MGLQPHVKGEPRIQEMIEEGNEHIEEKLARLLRLLNHKGVLTEKDIIEVEA